MLYIISYLQHHYDWFIGISIQVIGKNTTTPPLFIFSWTETSYLDLEETTSPKAEAYFHGRDANAVQSQWAIRCAQPNSHRELRRHRWNSGGGEDRAFFPSPRWLAHNNPLGLLESLMALRNRGDADIFRPAPLTGGARTPLCPMVAAGNGFLGPSPAWHTFRPCARCLELVLHGLQLSSLAAPANLVAAIPSMTGSMHDA